LIEACYLASVFAYKKPDHIHCHFIHGPTSLGMFLSELIGVPFSFTMHASLIWTDPLAFRTKLKQCKSCVSISNFNKQYVLETYGRHFDAKINVVHCGVQLPSDTSSKRPTSGNRPISVLAIGQLKRRKGFHVLIDAAKILKDRNIEINWTIIGEGDQRPLLERMIDEHGLEKEVTLAGAQLHEHIPHFLASADIFALPCVVGDDSTRDGIPVALMEAMAWRLPVVSTNIVGLPELIESGRDGILVESGDAGELAEAIETLAGSSEMRKELGAAAAAKIDREFNSLRSARQLAALFG
jgi:glycosyltransferase involved in cell wall biosynthesis